MNAEPFRRASARARLGAFILAGLLLLPLHAAQAFSLVQAYEHAQARDPVFLSARLQRDALAEKLPQAQALLRPGIHLRTGATHQSGTSSFGRDPSLQRTAGARNWSLQLTQVLWNASLNAGVEQARDQVRFANEQFRLAEQELILRVAQAYLEIGVAQEHLRVAGAQAEAVGQQLQLAEHQFQAGICTITDVHEASSRLHLVQSQRASAESELEIKTAQLEQLLGESISGVHQLSPHAGPPALQRLDGQDWLENARRHAPTVLIKQLQVEVAWWELQRAKAAHSPAVELSVSYGGNRSNGSLSTPAEIDSRSRSAQVGLQLTVPLYSGGGPSSREREAHLLLQSAEQDAEQAGRAAINSARKALSVLRHGERQLSALKLAVQASQASLDATRVGYQIGTRIGIDVLNAQQQLFSAERDLHRARTENLMARLQLKASIGDLVKDDLLAIDRMLAPSSLSAPNVGKGYLNPSALKSLP